MDFTRIKEELCHCVRNQLKEFSKSEQAREIYAIAFDLGEFDFVIRYQTLSGYEESKTEYIREYGYTEENFADESLTGFKYGVGDFKFVNEIAEEKLGAGNDLNNFFDSMAYYECDYIDDRSRLIPREELPRNIYGFLMEACLYCGDCLKNGLDFLDKTDDFILFVSEHDSADESKLHLISKTVDRDLYKILSRQ